jgi:NADH-quinone oxidoreductase subunit G
VSSPELVTVTVDGVGVQVPKGTGLVETAARAGIEIPVFCYEPRLGPPVGACRMCLCEIEGVPKPQAACTLSAQDGMVVRTAQSSPIAAEAQEGVLEFILLNHPLDCPVCDKGGECPLQDLTFRYGPGNTRMTFPKRTFEKPIPISPLIALDRERCILCYRCTRFSSDVAEDGQLIAENRGAQSVIATFEDEPYRAPFSGNVIELCPVGALTSVPYRFEARPWEIQNVPTVCGLCPAGCNVTATTREGKVKRVLSRNHPEIDQGWICDKGRFSFPSLYASDRVTDPGRRIGLRRFEDISWDDALDELERLGRSAVGNVLLALSGTETVEIAYALAKLVRQGFGSDAVVLPEEISPSLDAFRAPLAAIGDAELVVVLGDDPVIERVPAVDLWLRAARRSGAEIVTLGPDGSSAHRPGTAAETARELAKRGSTLGKRLRASDQAVLIWSGPGGHGGAELAALAADLGFATKPGCSAFYLPATPNGRAVAEAWRAAGAGDPARLERIGLLIVSGDEAAGDPRVRALAEEADAVVSIAMFADLVRGWSQLVLPATSYLERDGTTVNLEGRLQRLRRAVIPPAPDELAWLAALAGRFGIALEPHAPTVFAEVSSLLFAGASFAQIGEQAALPARVPTPAKPTPRPQLPTETTAHGGPLRLLRYRSAFSGPEVDRVPELQFQRPDPIAELSPEDARVRNVSRGDRIRVSSNGTSVELSARINRRLIDGVVRVAEEHVRALGSAVEVTHVLEEPGR